MTSLRHNRVAEGSPLHVSRRVSDAEVTPRVDPLLDAARESILAVGWKRSTLTDVARRAGVSRMTIYRRWPDMQTLMADLMTREWGGLLGETTEPSAAADPVWAISRTVAATVGALRQNELFA